MDKYDTDIKVFKTPRESFYEIAERFGLEVKERDGVTWARLDIPQTDASVTWFLE